MGSALPVLPNDRPPQISHGGTTQAQTAQPVEVTNPLLAAETPSPQVEQPQPAVPLQPGAQAQTQAGPQFLPITQFYSWYPLGGSPMFIPLQHSVQGSSVNQLSFPQQPLIFSPFRYFPFLSSPYMNQLGWATGSPGATGSSALHSVGPLNPQTLTTQPQISPLLPVESPSGASPSVSVPQPVQQQQQQQQNPQVVYMLQQPMNTPVGSLSSEELAMAANTGQLRVYLTSVLQSPSAGAGQTVNQAAGLKNPEQQSMVPTVAASLAGAAATQGPQPNTNAIPAGMKGATQVAATVQTPVQAEPKPSQGSMI